MRAALLGSLLLFCSTATVAAPAVGEKPKTVVLKGDLGSKVDGSEWSSEMIKGKVWALFYVDPDEKDSNEELEKALDAQKFDKVKYSSIGVINMDATWLPNAAIASALKGKQEDYPDTTYVKDLDKVLVKEWKMKDDAYNVLVFDKQGKVLFAKDGKFAKADIDQMIGVIKANLDAP